MNAKRLAELLSVAASFADSDNARVTLELRPQGPVTIRAENADQQFVGILMPLQ